MTTKMIRGRCRQKYEKGRYRLGVSYSIVAFYISIKEDREDMVVISRRFRMVFFVCVES